MSKRKRRTLLEFRISILSLMIMALATKQSKLIMKAGKRNG